MNKQEEIREGVYQIVMPDRKHPLAYQWKNLYYGQVDKILSYLHSQGCVLLKENQELPNPVMDIHLWRDYSPDMAYEKGLQDMLKADFKAVEPIKEE